MTAPANKVSNREIAITVFLKTLPATALVVLVFKLGKQWLISKGLVVPSLYYNFALIFALLIVIRFTAWRMLSSLASERTKDGAN
jgi:presenilin-like A22 family membrane protease